jgi:hypothetical protein
MKNNKLTDISNDYGFHGLTLDRKVVKRRTDGNARAIRNRMRHLSEIKQHRESIRILKGASINTMAQAFKGVSGGND